MRFVVDYKRCPAHPRAVPVIGSKSLWCPQCKRECGLVTTRVEEYQAAKRSGLRCYSDVDGFGSKRCQ